MKDYVIVCGPSPDQDGYYVSVVYWTKNVLDDGASICVANGWPEEAAKKLANALFASLHNIVHREVCAT